MEFLVRLFDPSGFPPRWNCGTWTPFAGWLHIVSDVLIFLAYSAIPSALAVVLVRRRDVPFPRVLALFVVFILSCGLSHLVDAMMFYWPVYRFLGVVKAVTAVASISAAVVLIGSLHSVLHVPSVRRANEALELALKREQEVRAQLEAARVELESRSSELTIKGRRLKSALNASLVIACRWGIDTGRVEWEMGYAHAATALGMRVTEFTDWHQLLDEADVAGLAAACHGAVKSGKTMVFEGKIAGAPHLRMRLSGSAEPEVKGTPAIMVGMFRVMPSGAPG